MNENELINRILDRYNLTLISYKKVRSAYKVTTDKGDICLKRFQHGKDKAVNGNILVEGLYENNFYNTPEYIQTKNKNYFVKYKNLFFYVTKWVNGTECNLDELDEVLNCSKLLAKFHLTTKKIDTQKFKIANHLKNWPQIYKNKLYDLSIYEKCIENKKIKNRFDITYMENIPVFYQRGLLTLNILNNSEYYKLSKSANKNHTICHDSFYYQNIIKKDNKYYIIDLDSIIIDLQITDLGKFIRRLMDKECYKWDFEKAKKMIEAYNSINKLSKDELEIMLSLIIFPHKFWKLGKKRYLKSKNWSENTYNHKLKKIICYNELKEKFLKDYIDYLYSYDKIYPKEG